MLEVRDACLCIHVQRAARALARQFDEAFRPLNLTNGQFSLLDVAEPAGCGADARRGPVPGDGPHYLTAALKPLVRRKLIRIVADPKDARARLLVLTPAGRSCLPCRADLARPSGAPGKGAGPSRPSLEERADPAFEGGLAPSFVVLQAPVDDLEEDRNEEDRQHGGGHHAADHAGADIVLAVAPAPVAIASGKTPATKAIEVIRMGRSRSARRFQRRFARASGRCFSPSTANSTIRMAFLAERPMVASKPDLEIDVIEEGRALAAPTAPITPKRNHQHHRERNGPTFIQRGQEQIDDEDGKPIERGRLRAGIALPDRKARSAQADAFGQLLEQLAHLGQRGAGADARRARALDFNGGQAVIAGSAWSAPKSSRAWRRTRRAPWCRWRCAHTSGPDRRASCGMARRPRYRRA